MRGVPIETQQRRPKLTRADAIELLSPAIARQFTPDDVVTLLRRVESETESDERQLSAAQTDLIFEHRVLPLVPSEWILGGGHDRLELDRQAAIDQLDLTALLVETLATLMGENIEARVLKGMASNELDYRSGLMRQSSDVDLLLQPDSLHTATELLMSDGFEPLGSVTSPTRAWKGAVLCATTGLQVDLHSRLSVLSDPPSEILFADADLMPRTGGLALNTVDRLLHAASHFVLTAPGSRRLTGLADITAIRFRHGLDVSAAQGRAAQLGLEWSAGLGLSIEAAILGRDPSEFEMWASPSRLEGLAYARGDRRLLFEHVLKVHRRKGLRTKLAYLGYTLAPSRIEADVRGSRRNYYLKALPSRRQSPR